MCAPSPPPAPDVIGQANAQGAANVDAARVTGRLSNPNLVGPGGNRTVTWDGDTPTVTTTLSPEEQAIYNQNSQNRAGLGQVAGQGINSLGDVIGRPVDLSGVAADGTPLADIDPLLQTLDIAGLPGMPSTYKTPTNLPDMPQASEAVRNQVIQAMMTRADSDMGKRQTQIESDLIARGIRPGTEAFAREMDTLNRQRNDYRTQAEIAGGDAAAQAFGMDLSRRKQGHDEAVQDSTLSFGQGMAVRGQSASEQGQRFDQQGRRTALGASLQAQQYGQRADLRRRQIAEMLTRRQTPINEIAALMSGSQVSNPFSGGSAGASGGGGFSGSTVAPAPIFGAAQAGNQYNTDVYNQQVSQANTQTGAAATIIAAAMMY